MMNDILMVGLFLLCIALIVATLVNTVKHKRVTAELLAEYEAIEHERDTIASCRDAAVERRHVAEARSNFYLNQYTVAYRDATPERRRASLDEMMKGFRRITDAV